jgi:hypothetical protein
VELPDSFPGNSRYAQLLKGLYGTKQAGRLWWEKLTKFLLEVGFNQSKSDQCLFYKINDLGEPMVIGVYLDDMVVAATPDAKQRFVDQLREHFLVKDLGSAKHLLGMKVHQDRPHNSIHISQPQLIDKLIEMVKLTDASTRDIPMIPNVDLGDPKETRDKQELVTMALVPYRSAIGMLLYIALGTRPDIAFAVAKLSQYCANPGVKHWQAVKFLARYLKGTRTHGILYAKSGSMAIDAHTDADHASDNSDRKSISGNTVMIGKAPISWRTCKQKCVALSTMEAELIALSLTVTEVLFWRNLLQEIGIDQPNPTTIFADNQSSIAYAKNRGSLGRAKHISLRAHFVKDELSKGKIQITYVKTSDNVADIFTKALPRLPFERHRNRLSVVALHADTQLPVQGSVTIATTSA